MRILLAALLIASSADAQSAFQLSRLVPGDYAFSLRAGGREVGTLTGSLTHAGSEWKYIETTTIPGRTEQTTELRMTDAGEMISLHQKGTTPGGATAIDVEYARGRAKGTATVPSATGMKTITIDTTMVAFALDDNALMPLLPALPVQAGAQKTIKVFESGQGEMSDMTLAVVGEERVTVPAGEADAWKIEGRGPAMAMFYVSKAAPYRLLRMTIANSPLEMVRVK